MFYKSFLFCLAAGVGLATRIPSFDGSRAMNDIATQLSFGVRAIGSPGHARTVQFILARLARTPARIRIERWTESDGSATHHLTNIVAQFDAANPRRIILGTHYDSIVRAYRDVSRPNAAMPGANNSASGVALLLELTRALTVTKRRPQVGVDFVFFDGEEGPRSLGAGDPQWRPLGSPYFARHLSDFYDGALPQEAIIFDMVCYRGIRLYPEVSSIHSEPTRVRELFELGHRVAPSVFSIAAKTGPIDDDQNAVESAGIPGDLVIGFEYEPWFNTTNDTLDKCSEATLDGVGRTVLAYLFAQ